MDANIALWTLLFAVQGAGQALSSFTDFTNASVALRKMYMITENKDF